jgi:hypothetical protein
MPKKGRKGEKELDILNCNNKRGRPKVQRRENVGGSLNLWAQQMRCI